MRKPGKWTLSLLALASLMVMSGCTYESGEKRFALEQPVTKPQDVQQDASAVEMLQTALEKGKTDPEAQTFWYKGHVINHLAARTTTSMFEGAVIHPDGYNVDARIARQPYQYYRIGDKRYIRVEDSWLTAREEPLPFDVLHGFEDLLPLFANAEQLADQPIYGDVCIPFQIKLTAAEWLQHSNSPLFAPLKQALANRPDMQQLLANSTVKMTVWVGREDQLLHQYETWIILPVPGGGYMDQQILFSFYKYNDPGLKIKPPEEVEKYLVY